LERFSFFAKAFMRIARPTVRHRIVNLLQPQPMAIKSVRVNSYQQRSQALTDDSKERRWADAQFKKSERATEGAQAMSEYSAERDAERAKTARLRALRLAKEAADKKAETKQAIQTKKRSKMPA
jgi:hypothetical protein